MEAAARAFCGYYSGDSAGALDPQAIQLVKRHFGHRKIDDLSEQEWAEALALLERERREVDDMRRRLNRAGEKEEYR